MTERPEVGCIEATLEVVTTEEGGRRSPLTTGYRGGLIVFAEWYETWVERGEMRCLGAVLRLCDGDELVPGGSGRVRLYPWADGALELADMTAGVQFRLQEGSRVVATGTVLRTLRERWPS